MRAHTMHVSPMHSRAMGAVLTISCALGLIGLLAGCGDRALVATAPLANGVYEVLGRGAAEVAQLPSPDQETRVLPFDRRFVKGGDDLPPEHILVRVRGYAPLDLSQAPRAVDSETSPRLLLNLRPAAARALRDLTARVEQAAIVVGGEVVTVHRIRVPIEGGGLQVSC